MESQLRSGLHAGSRRGGCCWSREACPPPAARRRRAISAPRPPACAPCTNGIGSAFERVGEVVVGERESPTFRGITKFAKFEGHHHPFPHLPSPPSEPSPAPGLCKLAALSFFSFGIAPLRRATAPMPHLKKAARPQGRLRHSYSCAPNRRPPAPVATAAPRRRDCFCTCPNQSYCCNFACGRARARCHARHMKPCGVS